MKKRQIIISTVSTVLIVGAIGAVSALNQPANTGADTSPVTTQLQQQQDELANHEARITNNEGNINSLANKTGTPTTSTVSVPAASPSISAPSAAATPASAPVTVSSYKELVIDSGTSDCEYTYSDGTTYTFHWKTSNEQGVWATDSQGQNGHWAKSMSTHGICDNSILGQSK